MRTELETAIMVAEVNGDTAPRIEELAKIIRPKYKPYQFVK